MENLAWFDQVMNSPRALTVLLVMMTTILSRRVYISLLNWRNGGWGQQRNGEKRQTAFRVPFSRGGIGSSHHLAYVPLACRSGLSRRESLLIPTNRA
jgi:hypothetical protein